MSHINFFGLDLAEIEEAFASFGEKPYRAAQLMRRVYVNGTFDPAAMSEFSVKLKEKIAEEFDFSLPEVVDFRRSGDGTVKLLLKLADGEPIETVLIPDEDRLTQCVSTQAGCAMGCAFCRTATAGLARHLTAGEIVAQVVAAGIHGGFPGKVTNVVFMGMGEPLHNFGNTVKAFDILTAPWGPSIGRKRITVSTCGLVEEMKRLPERILPSLAISLNATTDETRARIMPVNRRYPIASLVEALKSLPLPPKARFTIEYVLLGGVNDTPEDAKRLVKLLSHVRCKINLIPYNPHDQSAFKAPSPEAVRHFQTYLLERNFTAILRKSRGADIEAACGQLKAKAEDRGNDE